MYIDYYLQYLISYMSPICVLDHLQYITMPLFYSVVTRGTVVLAKHANYQGNFTEILEGVLIQIGPENKKQSLLHDRYLYHYICEDQIIYMCITDDVSIKFICIIIGR